jgi:hypothetical protein
MKRDKRFGILIATILAACMLFPSHIFAAEPQIQFIPVSFGHVAPGISAACGFQVSVFDQGTIKLESHVDNQGNPVRDTVNFQDWKLTFSGNGNSFTSPSPDPNSFDYATGTTVIHGLQLRIQVPGSGLIGIQTGTVKIDAEGNVTFESGPQISDGVYDSDICAALS